MDRKSVLAASVVETGQFQNRSHRNLLFYTDSCNMHCVGVNVCSFTTHSLFPTLIFQVRTIFDVIPATAKTREKTSFFLPGFSFLTYSCFILILPSLSLASFVPFFLHLFISFCLYSNFLSLCEPLLLPLIFSFLSLLPNVPLTQSSLVSEFFTLTALTFFSYKLTNAYLDVYSSM